MERLIAPKGIKIGIFRCLKAGVNPEYPEQGTPQGGVVSPLLANIALNGIENIPVLSLSENNNLSKVLKLLYSQALSFYFLTVTQVCRQNMEMEALKGFQRLCSPKVTKEGYTPVSSIRGRYGYYTQTRK
jgi:hypothetical protein